MTEDDGGGETGWVVDAGPVFGLSLVGDGRLVCGRWWPGGWLRETAFCGGVKAFVVSLQLWYNRCADEEKGPRGSHPARGDDPGAGRGGARTAIPALTPH